MWFAWLLIIVGIILLLQNLNILPAIRWLLYWPALLILLGVYLVKKKGGDKLNHSEKEEKDQGEKK